MIDSKLQSELRARFNPDGSDLRKMQLRMLDMLKYIDKICRENNITYWLSSGTCLGAVRHGGFIPWDDDVDIEMFKPDYKKLCRILKQENNPNYQLQDHSTDPEYSAPYAKLRELNSEIDERTYYDNHYHYKGIFIDIFCLEPSNSVFISRIGNSFQCRLYLLSKIKNKKIRRLCINTIYNVCHGIIYPILSVSSRYFGNKYRHVSGTGFLKERYKEEIFPIKRIKFEDLYLPIPSDYDKYLQRLFGDYNKLPNVESILTHTEKVTFYSGNKNCNGI